MKKQTEETNKIYDELVGKDQELIRMRRINQQNEDEREQLKRKVSLAMTLTKEAEDSKSNEIDKLRAKVTDRSKLYCLGFSKITHFPEQILTEHKDMKNSLASKLKVCSICPLRIPSIN